MSKHLKALLNGMGSLTIWPDRQYPEPTRGGFARDAAKIRHDVRKVGADLRKTVTTASSDDKSSNKR